MENPRQRQRRTCMKLENDELMAVVGRVGSGKSSLISAILGEMQVKNGSVTTRGTLAYAAQQPWIMNATVRENILFGYKYDKKFYEQTIKACALEPDLEMMANGDLTEIGERGINLSGGQKARISLARAVYSRADIYLFDDPLAAVDAHVGEHIFENVLGPNGMLKTRCRVLVTNAIPYLHQCHSVALLKDGVLAEVGKFEELNKRENGLLRALVKEFGKHNAGESALSRQASQVNIVENGNGSGVDFSDTTTVVGADLRRSSTSSLPRASIEAHLSRKNIISSAGKSNEDGTGGLGQLMTVETSETGKVKFRIYKEYIKSCGVVSVLIFLVSMVLNIVGTVGGNYWLKLWTDDSGAGGNNNVYYLTGYALFGVFTVVFVSVRTYVLWAGCAVNSAKISHEKMLVSVFNSPMSFFDTTPIGRLINRFSKDQNTIDEELPSSIMSWLQVLFQMVFSMAVIALSLPLFLIIVIPLSFVYIFLQNIYLQVSRDLKRLDSVSRSPIYQQFQETIDGISTIRAFRQNGWFVYDNLDRIDTNQKAVYAYLGLNRWIAVRLELMSALMIFAIAISGVFVLSKSTNSAKAASTIGLCMTYALNVTQSLNWCIRMYCKVETDIVSLERIDEYSHLPSEAPYVIDDARPDPEWPTQGKIEFVDYSLKYRAELPDRVLKNINVGISPSEKVGVVGRTGAGKTSLTLGLFRIIEPFEGRILIDDLDITKIGLYDLRSRISIIPQDPVLFSGSVRFNLDPTSCETPSSLDSVRRTNTRSDDDLWRALELTGLKSYVQSLDGQLDATVQQGGTNFSVGQRQLMCLARALVKNSRVIVMDEATAAIDPETDNLIQNLIRSQFKENTIITIAHRLNTVMDSDRILVLSKGQVVEFDKPATLLEDPNGAFYGFVNSQQHSSE
ncbi:Metal resistance protein YCF1 [Zancudomyces culisetae]|uniref:Metal resistance protein YCF1 n=1 Tax=Zancudomyces culisetae TaxID=1213189 RepID=A0A1R1PH18_ZANCU|nr:Metal resistance protein YCF1 [Zancudomyces culisetae]OMH82023.1 Metal resistance protein YCF1 [Zancudomyces culisetae]|eukprot:OMH80271.1 Metal resistance protein YCF1 [Zancudomyces culisetae]